MVENPTSVPKMSSSFYAWWLAAWRSSLLAFGEAATHDEFPKPYTSTQICPFFRRLFSRTSHAHLLTLSHQDTRFSRPWVPTLLRTLPQLLQSQSRAARSARRLKAQQRPPPCPTRRRRLPNLVQTALIRQARSMAETRMPISGSFRSE